MIDVVWNSTLPLPEELHVIVFDTCVSRQWVVYPNFFDFEVKHLQQQMCHYYISKCITKF